MEDSDSRTTLHFATRFGSEDCVRVLAEAGVAVDRNEQAEGGRFILQAQDM